MPTALSTPSFSDTCSYAALRQVAIMRSSISPSFLPIAVRLFPGSGQDKALTDVSVPSTLWVNMEDRILALVAENKASRLQRELKTRQLERQKEVVPYYDAFKTSEDDSEGAALFPPIVAFLHFPSAERFWKSDKSRLSSKRWAAVAPEITSEVQAYQRRTKRIAFSVLVKGLAEAGVSLSPGVVARAQFDEEQLAKSRRHDKGAWYDTITPDTTPEQAGFQHSTGRCVGS